jgi:hypothetical protein
MEAQLTSLRSEVVSLRQELASVISSLRLSHERQEEMRVRHEKQLQQERTAHAAALAAALPQIAFQQPQFNYSPMDSSALLFSSFPIDELNSILGSS